MRKLIWGLIALGAWIATADESGKVTVTGDRVSLRAAPKITAVLLDRAMAGDELTLKDNENVEWVGVVPPESVDLWIFSKYIENGKVAPKKLNVRSGPSFNHGVVGVLSRGTEVSVRSEIPEWSRIAPTADTTVWISRKFVDVKLPETELVFISGNEADVLVEQTGPAVEVVAEPSIEEIADVAAAGSAKIPDPLIRDVTKEQGALGSFSGLLLPTESSVYRLVDLKAKTVTACYVAGNKEQMEAFAQLPLKLDGKIYWANGLTLPILVPAKIKILND